jgi:RHH-type proline utilization regulon transcriptional repressor/proline dehydrogenase/delta 1-pyrroline-5-carboxylate dehydrogenase
MSRLDAAILGSPVWVVPGRCFDAFAASPGTLDVMTALVERTRDEALADAAVALAAELADASRARAPRAERRQRARLARLIQDPSGAAFVLTLADELLRIPTDERAAARLHAVVRQRGVPRSLGHLDRAALLVGASLAPWLPAVVMPLVRRRLRWETRDIIRSGKRRRLARYLARRRAEQFRLNINVLGEATLGDDEAARRLDATRATLMRPDVDYVSVKISAICSRVSSLAFDVTVERVVERLRPLFAAARESVPPKFVNLDMEEYHDLPLTVAAFRRLLDEEAFAGLDAGIALQAYLPDSLAVLEELGAWAVRRHRRAGGTIKIRIVKGANLPMEQVEAERRGWEQAPYPSKHDVDANFKRLLERALAPEFTAGLRVGLASHNVFDIAWGLVLSRDLGAEDRVDFEMLEGMAEGLALAVRDRAEQVVLYAPIVDAEHFDAAVAYFVRRFDENAAPENYLRSLLAEGDQESTAARDDQRARFLASVRDRHEVSATPRRTHDRRTPPAVPLAARFVNEPDTDFSLAGNRRWINDALAAPSACVDIPLVIDGKARPSVVTRSVDDPSDPASVVCVWRPAGTVDVDDAVRSTTAAAAEWATRSTAQRRRMLDSIALELARARGRLLVTMSRETAKTIAEGDVEVSEAIDFARYYGEAARTLDILAGEGIQARGGGVIVVASPWNFPVSIPAGGVLAALAAGHGVILKPAPEAVLTAWELANACWAAGVPRNLLQFLPCDDDEAGLRLVGYPAVRSVILTGSYETAHLFLDRFPRLSLRAETSGKNAIFVSATADLDLAISDLVRSAFGHAGQKCSAASLAVVDARLYDSAMFRRRLADAVRSLRVEPAGDLATDVPPLIRPPAGALARALTTLDDGEEWLVEPRQIGANPRLWGPGVKLGVRPQSWSHTTEWFGPVLALMRADTLDEAIALQNSTGYGLTGGISSLDPNEIREWIERVEVGNAYVNRTITGAIVARQPFGGWKKSSVGPTVKAGGPNYVLSLCDWVAGDGIAPSLRTVWERHFASPADPTALRSESNLLRYQPLAEVVTVRCDEGTAGDELRYALEAAAVAGARVEVSVAADGSVGVASLVEDDDALCARIDRGEVPRLRVLGTCSTAVLRAAHRAGVPVDTSPVIRHPRLELLRWVREQSVSETMHRHGRIEDRPAAAISSGPR